MVQRLFAESLSNSACVTSTASYVNLHVFNTPDSSQQTTHHTWPPSLLTMSAHNLDHQSALGPMRTLLDAQLASLDRGVSISSIQEPAFEHRDQRLNV